MHRVIQWGTGTVGSEMITAILDHRDDLEIVGALVYSDQKDGVDIGTLVGREPIGVTATTDVEQILELDADCVLYTPRTAHLDDVCRVLESGKNVVTRPFCSIRRGLTPPTETVFLRPVRRAAVPSTAAASTPATSPESYRSRFQG